MKKILVFIFLFLIGMCFNNQVAHAYPNYIRLGYSSCIGCHYNPAGGGMLTPYGKGISSTQSFNSSELNEDEEEKLSSAKYLQAFQGRVLDYKTTAKIVFSPCKQNILVAMKLIQNGKLILVLLSHPNLKVVLKIHLQKRIKELMQGI